MKQFEIVGNCLPAWNMTESTMCKLLGSRMTLGAAKKLADEMMQDDVEGNGEFISVDVDDGRGRVVYTVTPAIIVSRLTPRETRRQGTHPLYG